MQLKWGNKNQTLTLEAGSGHGDDDIILEYDKLVLMAAAKYVCDISRLKNDLAIRVMQSQKQLHEAKLELVRYKKKGFFLRILNFIFTR